MNLRRTFATGAVAVGLIATTALAQDIFHNINRDRHPYLGGAQDLIGQAYGKISEGQRAVPNMDGHAQKAKDLLEAASRELKLAEESEKR